MSLIYPTDNAYGSTLYRSLSFSPPAQAVSIGGWEIGDLLSFSGASGTNAYFHMGEPRREVDRDEFMQYLPMFQDPYMYIYAPMGNAWVLGPFKGVVYCGGSGRIEVVSVTAEHAIGIVHAVTFVIPTAPADGDGTAMNDLPHYDASVAVLDVTATPKSLELGSASHYPRVFGDYDTADHYLYYIPYMTSNYTQVGLPDPARSSDVHFMLGTGTHFGDITVANNPFELLSSPFEYGYMPTMVAEFSQYQKISATATASASATAVKLEAIPGLPAALSSAPSASPAATAALTAKIKLAQLLAAQATASLPLTTRQFIAASASAQISVSPKLSTEIPLAASMSAAVAASAALFAKIKLVGKATLDVALRGPLQTAIRLIARPTALTTSQASLLSGVRLHAKASAAPTGASALITGLPLKCVAGGVASARCSLTCEVYERVSCTTIQRRGAVYNSPRRLSVLRRM